MANIHGQKEVQDIVKVWGELNTTISESISLLTQYKNVTPKLPSSFIQQTQEYAKQQQNLTNVAAATKEVTLAEKERQKTLQAISREQARQKNADLIKQRKEEAQRTRDLTKTESQLRRERERNEKALEREAKAIAKTQGLYNKVQIGINNLTKQYNDLALRRELNGKLSAEEEVTLGKLEAKLNKYNSALKNVDARIGRHQRNVGNYKSAFDGLGFSVAQISRELPAFANSMQTGFMAISNNIPMLVDEIQRLKRTNIELAATGQPTTSVFKSLGKAIFSFQGMLGIAITALTVFAPKILDWAFGMSEAEKATQKATEELEKQNESLRENIRLREQQISGVRNFINDSTIGQYLKELNENPLGFQNLKEGEAVLAEISERLERIGSSNAKILKDQNILQSDRVEIAANLLQIERLRNNLDAERLEIDKNLAEQKKIQAQFDNGEIDAKTRTAKMLRLGTTSLTETLRIQQEIVRLEEANNRLIGKTVFLEQEKGKAKEKQAKLQGMQLDMQETNSFRAELEKLIKGLEETKKLYSDNSKEARELQKVIDDLRRSTEGYVEWLNQENEELLENIENQEKLAKTTKKLKDEYTNFMDSFVSGFFSDAGFSSINKYIDGTFDRLLAGAVTFDEKTGEILKDDRWKVYFNSITETAKEAFSFINQFQQDNFNVQYERLETQRNVAIQFAGESTAAREEIERQYDEKKRQIELRQARAQKESAIFNAIINTAQAVVSTLATAPWPSNIPLAALVGALGAAQIALISSQSIPQFKDGVRDFGGGLAVVGDGGVSEVITTKEGKAYKTPNKDTLVNLPKGANVYSNYGEFENELNMMLGSNGILPERQLIPIIKSEQGLSKQDFQTGISDLKNAIANGKGGAINFDERGFRKFLTSKNTITEILNDSVSFKGKSV